MLTSYQKKIEQWLFTRGEQQAFLEDVSNLIQDGVAANQAIETVYQVSKGHQKQVAEAILNKIAEGKHLADGMAGWFSKATIEIVRAGENGGTLAENLQAAARALKQDVGTISAFIGALTYPLVVIILGLCVAVYIRHSVLESFATIKPIVQWPGIGQQLYQLASFVQNGWWVIVLILLALIVGISRLLHSLTGKVRIFLDNWVIFSIYRQVIAARLMETLGLLLTNGIVLKQALAFMQHQASPYLKWHLLLMEFRLSGGRDNIAEVLETGLISSSDIVRLKVIARGKGFEQALVRLGRLAAERNMKRIQLMTKIAGGILLTCGAAFAGFMIFAVYSVGSFVGS